MPPISPSDRLLGDLLVARHVLTLEQLDEAVRLAEKAVGWRDRRHRRLVAVCRAPAPKQTLQPQQEDDRHHQPHATNDPGAEPLGDGEP